MEVFGQTDNTGLTGQEIANCALSALGINALYAFASSSSTSWSITAITRVFKTAASKFLGPVGVIIAAASFSYCLYLEYQD